AHEDQSPGFESDGGLSGGDVGVAVVDLAVFAPGGGADDWDDALVDTIEERRGIDGHDFADTTEVESGAWPIQVIQEEFAAGKDLWAGEAPGGTAERVDGGHDLGINFARQDLIHDASGGGIGHALALDEVRSQAGLFHGAGDRFAAAVDDQGVDLDGLE